MGPEPPPDPRSFAITDTIANIGAVRTPSSSAFAAPFYKADAFSDTPAFPTADEPAHSTTFKLAIDGPLIPAVAFSFALADSCAHCGSDLDPERHSHTRADAISIAPPNAPSVAAAVAYSRPASDQPPVSRPDSPAFDRALGRAFPSAVASALLPTKSDSVLVTLAATVGPSERSPISRTFHAPDC